MASIYMRIDKNDDIKGAATVSEIGKKKGFFALDSFSWSGMRGVSVEIGNSTNEDSGMVAMGEVNCSKEVDGASPYLLTFLFAPGKEGKTIQIVFTKPGRDGKGLIPYLSYTLDNVRMSNYGISGSSGGQPSESFSLTYTQFKQEYWYEDVGGELKKSEAIVFDTRKAELQSGVKLK